jgi:hypothetical protein
VVWFAIALFVSAVLLMALTWLIRTRGWILRIVSVAITLLFFTYAAFATLAVIRA